MNKSILYLFTMILFMISLSSCKKYLDKRPDNFKAIPSTIADLQALLDNAENMNLTPSFGQASDDDYFILAYDAIPNDNWKKAYVWKLLEYSFPNDWSALYLPVYNANLCLEILKTIPRTIENAAAWDNVKGSALFYRAHSFLQLAWTFCKGYDEASSNSELGIPVRLTSDFNGASVRGTVKEAYERIIMDTKEAAELLPNLPAHKIRPSKDLFINEKISGCIDIFQSLLRHYKYAH